MICHTLVGYLRKFIFPFQLSEIYSYPLKTGDFLPYSYYISPFAAAGLITFIAFAKFLKREMIFGLLFFLVNILVTQAVLLEDGYMSNRYAYLPGLGIFLVMAASYNYFRDKSKMHRRLLALALGLLLLFFSIVTWQRSQVWKDTLTLFNNAVEHDPGSAFAWNNRGIARYSENDLRGALSDFEQAIRIHPKYSGAFYNRGSAYHAMKEFSRANKDYTMAINLNPNFANCYVARGNLAMNVLQNDALALMDYSRAIQLNPANALAYYSRGVLRLRMKEVPMACEDFHRVRQLGYDRADDLIRQFCE
jgi:tetratricopeptide (TPR) repeat protein